MPTYDSQTGRLSPQALLQQRYMIVGQAGRGGMGAVYEAVDMQLGRRRVAVKEMSQAHLSPAELQEATARFNHEARMLGSLQHPNLPHIFDSFSEQGRFYLVMDFIDGKTLQQLLRSTPGKPLPVPQVLHYARQLCNVLSYLHQHQPPIIFRDVKPSNIMVTANGQLYLIDFGIARFFEEGKAQDTMLLGSPGYASPEQHGSAQSTPRTDIYGLGATLHYCLTGRDPYYASDKFSFAPIRQYNPQVPPALEQLVLRMVSLDERQRPASCAEVLQGLQGVSEQAMDHTVAFPQGAPPNPAVSAAPGRRSDSAYQPTVFPPQPQQAAVPAPPQRPGGMPGQGPFMPPAGGYYPANNQTPQQRNKLWSPAFLALFLVVLVLSVGSSLIAISLFYTPRTDGLCYLLEAGISWITALLAVGAWFMVPNSFVRGLLLLAALSSFVSGLLASGLGSLDVQILFDGALPLGLFRALLPITSAIALLSLGCWLLRPLPSLARISLLGLYGISLICILLTTLNLGLNMLYWHLLLLLGLIGSQIGLLIAAQLERTQRPAPSTNNYVPQMQHASNSSHP